MVMQKDHLYVEHLTQELNSYELKMFRVQHDETQFFEYATPDYDEGCRFLYFPLV